MKSPIIKSSADCSGPLRIGSIEWWTHKPIYTNRGLIDSTLRLFELGHIDRKETMALIEFSIWQISPTPIAPWEKLTWE